MNIEYLHASVFGNGVKVADEFKARMAPHGVSVTVHHIDEMKPRAMPPADLYLFSSPGRFGKSIRKMRRFLKKLQLPAGTPYALLTTEAAPRPNKRTGQMPTDNELAKYQRVRPIMNEILQAAGLVGQFEDTIFVTGLKGPLEEGWQSKVETFVSQILAAPSPNTRAPDHAVDLPALPGTT